MLHKIQNKIWPNKANLLISLKASNKNIYENSERNPYLQNMNPNIKFPYCKPYYSDKESNNFGYPVSLTYLGYATQNTK